MFNLQAHQRRFAKPKTTDPWSLLSGFSVIADNAGGVILVEHGLRINELVAVVIERRLQGNCKIVKGPLNLVYFMKCGDMKYRFAL